VNGKELVPLITQLLSLGLKLANIIELSRDISVEDKAAMKAAITEAKDNVTYWGKVEEDDNDILEKD
jgi:hypothetical protein